MQVMGGRVDLGLILTLPRQQLGQLGLNLWHKSPPFVSYRGSSAGVLRGGALGPLVETDVPQGP